MKTMRDFKKIISFIALVLFCINVHATNFLVNDGDSFLPKDWAIGSMSYKEVAAKLGYNQNQFFIYRDRVKSPKINFVIISILEGKVLFLDVNDGINFISKNELSNYLVNFHYNAEMDDLRYLGKLEKAISNIEDNYSLDYVSRALKINVPESCSDTSLVDIKNKLKYVFKDKRLISFTTTDGLGKWARFYKKGNYYPVVEKYAKLYWKNNNEKIIWELNTICDALAKIPSGFDNEYCGRFGENGGDTFNAKVMTVALYGDNDISEKELIDITHNKVRRDGKMTYYGKNCTRYFYKDFYFLFDEKGKLYKVIDNR